ncbi:MAG: GHKL domain-containing protein [Lachnospiraceae bacterium]|nr:GHKL domain-containing protein [Lachnospiraceae bacterium]
MDSNIRDILGNLMVFLAIFAIAGKSPRREWFAVRFLVSCAAFCAVRYLVFRYVLPLFPDEYANYVRMVLFSVLVLCSAMIAFVSYEFDFFSALFCGSVGYCVQHGANKMVDIFLRYYYPDGQPAVYYAIFVGTGLLVILILFLSARRKHIDRIAVDNRLALFFAVLLVVITIVLDILSRRATETREQTLAMFSFYSFLLTALLLSFEMSLLTTRRTEQELETVRAILEGEQDQYLYEKSMMDLINIRTHDLKHRFAALDEDSRVKAEKEIKPLLDAYDTRIETSNPALNVILTRKNFTCKEKGIQLTAAVSGECIEFMDEVDIYSLFGNILDNAIEASEKLEDPEKKVISLSVRQTGYFVTIHEENYTADRPRFEDGLPQTTKPDAELHGFGMKSIRMITERYGGNINIETKDDRFSLDILFPV